MHTIIIIIKRCTCHFVDFHSAWKLEIVKGLEDRVAAVGEKVEFSVKLTEPVPAAEVAWYANGVELKPSDLWAMKVDGSFYSLILRQAPLLPQQEITFAARDALSLAKLTIISKYLKISIAMFSISLHLRDGLLFAAFSCSSVFDLFGFVAKILLLESVHDIKVMFYLSLFSYQQLYLIPPRTQRS